jgi:formylglycine-generating enzyme required for sulfatase activity
VPNSIGMTLVRIEPGTFTMGSNQYDEEKPPHKVRITRAFLLGAYPVTQDQYQKVMGEHRSHFKGPADLPVESVSWFDAVEFCNKLSTRENRSPCYRINGTEVELIAGNGYRLPTEAEWEYACRAGSTGEYPFDGGESALGKYAWYDANSGKQTHPVGEKEPNAWGLHDMLGNVWEWCWDWYDADYYKKSPAEDPLGAPKASASGLGPGLPGR